MKFSIRTASYILLILSFSLFGTGFISAQSQKVGIDPTGKVFNDGSNGASFLSSSMNLVGPKADPATASQIMASVAPPTKQRFGSGATQNTTFQDLENQLVNIKRSDWGLTGDLVDFTPVYINGYEFVIKGTLNFAFHENQRQVITGGCYPGQLKTPVDYPTKHGTIRISGWFSFWPEEYGRGLSFVCPSYGNANLRIGDYNVPYKSIAGGYYAKIFFAKNGSINDIHIADPLSMNVYGYDLVFQHHEGCQGDLMFFKNGAFRRGFLGKAATVEGVTYPKGTCLMFYENGKVEYAGGDWSQPVVVKGIKIGHDKSGAVTFDENGQISSIYKLAENTTIAGTAFKKGDTLRLATEASPRIGVNFNTLDAQSAAKFNLPISTGAYLAANTQSVAKGGAAEAAGLKPGDIITSYGAYTLGPGVDLSKAVQETFARSRGSVPVTVYRAGKTLNFTIAPKLVDALVARAWVMGQYDTFFLIDPDR